MSSLTYDLPTENKADDIQVITVAEAIYTTNLHYNVRVRLELLIRNRHVVDSANWDYDIIVPKPLMMLILHLLQK